MKKEYKFSGDISGTSFIILEDNKLTIKRKGFWSAISHGLKGEKTINLSAITGIQYKPAGLTIGYLQFVLMGSQESKAGISSAREDENTVCWGSKVDNKYAEEIKAYIESYLSNKNSQTTNKNMQEDKYDKLGKIKKLLDDGVLSQAEFDTEKRKILQ